MSAYVVENETINKIVTYLKISQSTSYERRKLKEMGYDLEDVKGAEKLHAAMLAMNVESVNQRYGEKSRPPVYAKTAAKIWWTHSWLYRDVAWTYRTIKYLCEGKSFWDQVIILAVLFNFIFTLPLGIVFIFYKIIRGAR